MIPPRAWIIPAAVVVLLMATCLKAKAEEQIPCWKVKAARSWAGSDSAAEALARKHGYTKSQIEAAKRCLK
jgi:hypothetical protein